MKMRSVHQENIFTTKEDNMSDKLSFDEKMKLVEQGKIDKKTGKFTSMDAMREAKGFKPGETPAQFNTRRSVLEGAKKTLKATKYGKIAAGVVGAGLALKQYLKSKTNKAEDVDKKSTGGMTIGKGKDYIKDLL